MRWDIGTYHKKIRQKLKAISRIKTWQLLVLLLIGTIVAVILLRLNSLNMMDYRHAVVVADEKGDKAEIQRALSDLQKYVTTHMNTSLGDGFYLTQTYDRDREAILGSAGDATNPNSTEYQTASVECRSKWQGGRDSFRNDYVKCVIDRVSALTGQTDPGSTIGLPNAETYKINFAPPLWSPDPAGFAVLICFVIVVVIIGRFIGVILLRLLLKRRFSVV